MASFVRAGIAAALAVFGFSADVGAKQITEMQIAGWRGGAYTSDANGQFTHCAVHASYKSGITMFISMGRDFSWTLGFAHEGWQLNPGDRYRLMYRIDGSAWRNAEAQVIGKTIVKVPMPPESELVSLFRRGLRMEITAAGQDYAFNLDGTSASVMALSNCVSGQLTLEGSKSAPVNPFGAPTTTKSAKAPDGNASNEEAIRIATNFLLAANIPNARMLGKSETPAALQNRGAVWSWQNGLGALDVVGGTVEQNVSNVIATDAQSCKGKFASGSNPPDNAQGAAIYQAFTACEGSPTILTHYLLIARPAGGFYLFALADNSSSSQQSGNRAGADIPSLRKAVFGSTR